MKIRLVDYVCNLGGGEIYIKELARALSNLTTDIEIEFASHGKALQNYKSFFELNKLPIRVIDFPPSNYRRIVKKRILNIPGTSKLNQLFGVGADWSVKVDPLVLKDADAVIFPWIHKHRIPDDLSTKVIGTVHDCILFDIPNLISKKEVRQEADGLNTFFNNRNCKIVSISNSTSSALMDNFKISRDNFSVIPNGTNHITLEKAKRGEPLVKDSKYLLYPANTFPHKNHEFLFAAFAAAKTNYKLVLTGEGTNFREISGSRSRKLLRCLKSHNLLETGRVIGLGYLPKQQFLNVRDYSAAIVFPSLMEGFGFPLIEAIIAGKPLLLSDTKATRETIELVSGQAIFFNPKCVDELTLKIEALEKDQKNMKYPFLSQSGNLVHRKWETVAENYIKLVKH